MAYRKELTMRIFSKKKFEFRVEKGSTILVEPFVFKDISDSELEAIKKDPLFQWAISDGNLEVIGTSQQQKTLENDPTATVTATVTPTEKDTTATVTKK
jgi:hypothetical protein